MSGDINVTLIKSGRIFMGDGAESAAKCYELERRLRNSFSDIAALQQRVRNKELAEAITEDNLVVANDIFKALTGYKLSIKDLGVLLAKENN